MKILELSHVLVNRMPVYPGDEPPRIYKVASVEKDSVAQYELVSAMHAGTHIDAPMHMIEGGKAISNFATDKFVGNAVIIDARGQASIGASLLDEKNITPGDIVIVVTGWYKKFGQEEYFASSPLVEKAFAQKLIDFKVSMLGLDTPGPDDAPFEVHKMLLGQEILIIENLTNTESLIDIEAVEIIALPLNIEADGSPARVIARVDI